MSIAHRGGELTDALIAMLESDGWLVGDAEKPDGAGWQGTPGSSTFLPYVDVWPATGGEAAGTLGDPFADVQPEYIIRVFGATRAQCEFVSDQVWARMLTSHLTLSGRRVQLVTPEVLPGVIREDASQPPVWYAPGRWRIWTTPD